MRLAARDAGAMRIAGSDALAPWTGVICAFAGGALLAWWIGSMARARQADANNVDDETLQERIRVRVADIVSRPDAVHVSVEQGVVRLAGEVHPSERDALLRQLVAVPGVYRVRNALTATQAGS